MTQGKKVVPLTGHTQIVIPVDRVVESPYLPRKSYDDESLLELGDAISDQGLMHPILVSRLDNGDFELHAGSRRLRAAKRNGYDEIPATITENSNSLEVVVHALVENAQREPLEPLEEANAYLWLCQKYDMSPAEVAASIGKSSGYVIGRLKLLDIAKPVQQLIVDGQLAPTTAQVLVQLDSGEMQVDLANEVLRDGLNASQARQRIHEICEGEHVPDHGKRSNPLNVRKYRLKIAGMHKKMSKAFHEVSKLPMTPEERGMLMQVHIELELASKNVRDALSQAGYVKAPRASGRTGNIQVASNHRQEWPMRHIKLFDDRSLSDEYIAEVSGRTLSAVKSMRSALNIKV